MNTAQANERLARAGSTPRQRRWGQYRAFVRSVQYDDRAEWWQCKDEDGTPLLSRYRQPLVQLGEAGRIVNELLTALASEERAPTVEISVAGNAEAPDAVTAAGVLEGMGVPHVLTLPVVDLLGGSCALAFSRPDPSKPKRHDWLRLQPEWCEPVFATQARSKRARQIAAELGQWMDVPSDEEGPHLAVPDEARPDDIVFLRYQPRVVEELAEVEGGIPSKAEVYWERTDYLPDVIVDYHPIPVVESGDRPPRKWKPRLPVSPHGWGLVPIVWVTEWMAEPGELDGRSILSPAVLSLCEQADYVASFGVTSTNRNADPDVYTIDLEAEDVAASIAAGGTAHRPQRTTGGKVFHFTSTSSKGGEIGLLETEGNAAEASREQLRQLRQAVAENSGVVRHDPEKSVGVQSGEAMKRQLRPLLALVSAYEGVISRGLERMVQLEARVLRRERVISSDLEVRVGWPEIVAPTATDVEAWARAGGLLRAADYPLEEVVKLLARKLGHEDPDQVAADAVRDAEERLREVAAAAAQGAPGGE